MATGRLAPERALLGAVVVLVLLGVLDPVRALAGASNGGVATVAVLFVVAAAVRRSGALSAILHRVLGSPRTLLWAQVRLVFPVAALSAFLNNTPIVAMLVPDVRRWADHGGISPSTLLMPLSFAAILGGMCTLIGTSTNLLIDGLLAERGLGHLGIFWITPLGVIAAAVGLLALLVLGRRLLPERRADDLPLADRRLSVELVVDPDGPLVGRTLASVHVPGLRAFAPLEVRRGKSIVSAPRPDVVLGGDDRLLFAAPSAEVLQMQRLDGLSPITEPSSGPRGTLVEVVVTHQCPIVGREVGDGTFRQHYGAAVVAVGRDGHPAVPTSVASWRLEAGDILLVETDDEFVERHRFGGDLVVVSDHGRARPHAAWHPGLSLLVVVAMAGVAAIGLTSMLVAAVAASAVLVAARVTTWEELADDIEWHVLLAIVAALGLGAALTDTGAAAALAGGLVQLGGQSPWLVLAVVYLATVVTTEMVTNNAAAVLLLPIALDAATRLGVSWMPFAAVVMVGASASFVTPIGYQTNLMVMGPGGYRFGDFARLGTPVALAVGVATITVAPLVWPFFPG